jgi:hypothetical protein
MATACRYHHASNLYLLNCNYIERAREIRSGKENLQGKKKCQSKKAAIA